jgi:polynucleotide 5'-hydroxyl-kinase GRC3/NOL9
MNRCLTGQGKSARSLPAVCYLDLDSSKPEYTPQGQISLVVVRSLNLGPSFTHPATSVSPSPPTANETIRSHCVPTNLANYRDYYRACAEDLFLTYKSLQAQDPLLPLIVNTSGSLYTSDFDLLTAILARLKPHHAVHLGETHAIDTEQATKLHSLQTIALQYRGTVHEITAQLPPSLSMRTDAEFKAMHMQSYFHLTKPKLSEPMWTSNRMSELVPWEFCYEETEERMQNFVGFATYAEPVEPASLLPSLNGSIVQIMESTSSAIPTPYTALTRTKRHGIPHFDKSDRTGMVEALDPRTSKMLCTALVRGFDLQRKVVQVLVPKSHGALLYNLSPERTVLVGGCCDPPEWAYLEDVQSTDVSRGHEGASSEKGDCRPWVEDRARMDDMGYLNTVRRVRKFQT